MIERLWSSNSGLKPAGDTFNGGFIVALAEGQDVIGAVTFVNGCGALSVKLLEAQTSIPTSIDVDKFLKARFGQLACLYDFRNPSLPLLHTVLCQGNEYPVSQPTQHDELALLIVKLNITSPYIPSLMN